MDDDDDSVGNDTSGSFLSGLSSLLTTVAPAVGNALGTTKPAAATPAAAAAATTSNTTLYLIGGVAALVLLVFGVLMLRRK